MLTGWLVGLSLVMGLSWVGSYAQFPVVRVGGPKMRSARSRCADPGDGAQVYLYRDRDSSIAP